MATVRESKSPSQRRYSPAEKAQAVRLDLGALPSIGSIGDSFDNALAETTNGLYKAECIRGPSGAPGGPWTTSSLSPSPGCIGTTPSASTVAVSAPAPRGVSATRRSPGNVSRGTLTIIRPC